MKWIKIVFAALIISLYFNIDASANTDLNYTDPESSAHTGNEEVVEPIETLKPQPLATALNSSDALFVNPVYTSGFMSIAEVIRGRVAGLWVSGSFPYYYIRIRGAFGPPLVVIDNMPFYNKDDESVNALLNSIAVADIESVEVLKNIASTSIYGPGSGNGVLRIKTKRYLPEVEE